MNACTRNVPMMPVSLPSKFCGGKNSAYNKAAVKSQLAKEIPQENMSTKKKKNGNLRQKLGTQSKILVNLQRLNVSLAEKSTEKL